MLKEKAKELSEKSGQFVFKASNGYIQKFANRMAISFKTIHGESGSVDADLLINWKVKEIIENVSRRIFLTEMSSGYFGECFQIKPIQLKTLFVVWANKVKSG